MVNLQGKQESDTISKMGKQGLGQVEDLVQYHRASEQWSEDSHLVYPLYSVPVPTPCVAAGLPSRKECGLLNELMGWGGEIVTNILSSGYSCSFLFLPSFPFPYFPGMCLQPPNGNEQEGHAFSLGAEAE